MRKEIIGDAVLYLGDCREVLLMIGRVDAVITDPPYGIGVDRVMSSQSGKQYGNAKAAKSHYESTGWDDSPMDDDITKQILSMSDHQIIFGGNYFNLPPSRCWLIWDKENGGNNFADAEMAWTNLDKPVRLLRHMWNGMLRKGGEDRNGHPTQKPLGVMEWCLSFIPDAQTILDPFMGSGTTGVAAMNMKRSFIGIEREEKYFDIACRRIEDAQRQGSMF